MILFVVSMVSSLVGAAALTRVTRPRSLWAHASVFVASWWALLVVVGEGVGRVSFTRGSVAAGCVVVGVLGAVVLARTKRSEGVTLGRELRIATRPWVTRVLLLAWAALLVYSAVAVWSLSATVPDVVRYHLPQGVAWVREARVGVVPELDYRANYFPHNAQLTHALVLVLTGEHRLVGMPSLVFSGALWVCVSALALRACGVARRWALGVALIASSVGPVLLQMRSEMPDVAHGAALVLAFVIAIDQGKHFGRSWLAFGVAAGLALGSKSSGPLAMVVLGAAWVYGSGRGNGCSMRGWSIGRVFRSLRVGRAVACGVVVAIVGGWVYGANLVAHANPVFPMALRMGPITLPGPDRSSGITMNPWIYDFGASPVERVLGGISRWPRLLMHMPPFDDMTRPSASGFGYVVPASLVAAVLGVLGAAARGKGSELVRPLVGRHTRATMWALIIALLVYTVLYLSFVSLITAPHSTVDARYQVHLALIAVLLACWSGAAAKKRARVVWTWAMALVAVVMMRASMDHWGHRGVGPLREALAHGHDPAWVYTGNPLFVMSDPEAFNGTLGDSDIIVFGRGWAYPFMFPDLTRRVYPTGGKGPHVSVVDPMGIDEAMMLRLTERSHVRYALEREYEDADERYAAYNARWMREGGRTLLEDYFVELARVTGSGYLVSQTGRHPWFDRRSEWAFVFEDESPFGARRTAVYRFVGDASP